jgi:hypothetical protein
VEIDERLKDLLVEVVLLAEVVADRGLVQTFALVQELGDALRRVLQQALLDQVLDALLRIHVELLPADRHHLCLVAVFAVLAGVQGLHLGHDLHQFIFEVLQKIPTCQKRSLKSRPFYIF